MKKKYMPVLIKRRRKSDHCLNCGESFNEKNNYCPNCGQENNHNSVSFGTLVVDFFHNYFSFDSKFSNSLIPFFFDPGNLTKKFVNGKRASFVNPVRLYLVLSLVFFFVFSMVSQDLIKQGIDDIEKAKQQLTDSTQVAMNVLLLSDSTISAAELVDTTIVSGEGFPKFNIKSNRLDSLESRDIEEGIKTYLELRKDQNMGVDQIIDSLKTSSMSAFQLTLAKNLIRIDRAEKQIVISHALKSLPLMMLILIPLFALVLKLFYIRDKQFYITHLIHSLHLHSLAYVVYSLAFLAAMYWLPNEGWGFTIILICLVIVGTHSYFSFLKVYDQKWMKTMVKFFVVGCLYFWLLFFATLIEMFFSVVTY